MFEPIARNYHNYCNQSNKKTPVNLSRFERPTPCLQSPEKAQLGERAKPRLGRPAGTSSSET
jgi:hypothetical protein